MVPPEIQSVRDQIWAVWEKERDLAKTRPAYLLNELRHRADEMRNNPQVDASYRIAAGLVHDAAVLALEQKEGK